MEQSDVIRPVMPWEVYEDPEPTYESVTDSQIIAAIQEDIDSMEVSMDLQPRLQAIDIQFIMGNRRDDTSQSSLGLEIIRVNGLPYNGPFNNMNDRDMDDYYY